MLLGMLTDLNEIIMAAQKNAISGSIFFLLVQAKLKKNKIKEAESKTALLAS